MNGLKSDMASGVDRRIRSCSIFMNKTASIAFLEMQGANGRKFHLSENAMRSVLLPEYSNQNQHVLNDSSNLMRRVHLQRVSIEPGSSNLFPFPIGIHISGIEGSEHSISGDRFNYIFPGRHGVSVPNIIYESFGDEELMTNWDLEFSSFNAENLETLCVMFVPDSDVCMIHLSHPCVQLLDKRFDEFGTVAPTSQPTTTPNWRQIQRGVFQTACSWLREHILSKSSKTVDLSQLTISFGKIDKTNFNEIPASCFTDMQFDGDEDIEMLNSKKSKFANILMQKPFNLDIKISLEYRFSSNDNIVSDAGGNGQHGAGPRV